MNAKTRYNKNDNTKGNKDIIQIKYILVIEDNLDETIKYTFITVLKTVNEDMLTLIMRKTETKTQITSMWQMCYQNAGSSNNNCCQNM